MTSAPTLHAGQGFKRLSAVEACRVLAGEVWRRERELENFRAGGLNSEKAVRQRLQSFAMEMQRAPDLHENVELHLYSIDWANADPLTILERTEGLVDRQCRETYASVDAMLREKSRATELAIRLLVLQSLAGRLGRWAVRAGEIPDARIARAHYRELGAPEWSQYCKLTEDANIAFESGDYPNAIARVFEADRLVRTPAGLLMAAVAMSRTADFVSALWTARVCLLEPTESFESVAALRKARTLESRLRDIVIGRSKIDTDECALLGESSEVVPVAVVDIVDEQQDILETESAELAGCASPPMIRAADPWGERYLAEAERAREAAPVAELLITPKPLLIERPAVPKPKSNVLPTRNDRASEERIPTRPSSVDHQHLIECERAINDDCTELESAHSTESLLDGDSTFRLVSASYEIGFPPEPEEDTYVPAGPSEEVSIEELHEETEIPADPELERLREVALLQDPKKIEAACRVITAAAGLKLEDLLTHDLLPPKQRSPSATTERIIRRVVRANQPEDPSTDVLGTMTLPMSAHSRETALAALDREESSLPASEGVTAQLPATRFPSLPTGKIALKRIYEVTQIVRARGNELEIDSATEQLPSRSPLDRER